MIILAIDPGTTSSAWLVFDTRTGQPLGTDLRGIEPNGDLLERLRGWHDAARVGEVPFIGALVVERIEPRYGLNVGWETIRTCEFVGALGEAAHLLPVALLRRSDILRHLGVAARGAADPGVRAALMDRWGGAASVRKGGPLHGITTHLWSALSVAVTWADMSPAEREAPR